LTFEGKVFSGRGEGKRFLELPWVRLQIQEKLGFSPYAGTLNIRLTEESIQQLRILKSTGGILIEPKPGYCPSLLFKAAIDAVECAVVVPKVPNYPNDVLEVIAPAYLRGKLGLADGNLVAVIVTV